MIAEENPKNAKEAIFAILIESYPQRAADIWREVNKRGIKITLQGIVKDLKMMENEGIVEKDEPGFSISERHIQNLRQTLDKLEPAYKMPKAKLKRIATGVEIYTLQNMLEQDSLWSKISKDWIKNNPKDKTKAWIGRHCWWLLARLEHEDTFHDFMIKHGAQSNNLVTGNTLLDKAAVEYYTKKGIRIKIDKKADLGNVYIESFGDFYIRCEMPKVVSDALEKIYKKAKKIEYVNMKEVIDVLKGNIPITVVAIKDKAAARKMRQDILNRF